MRSLENLRHGLVSIASVNLRTYYCIRLWIVCILCTFYRQCESSTVHSRERLSRWKQERCISFKSSDIHNILHMIFGQKYFRPIGWRRSISPCAMDFYFGCKNSIREYGYFSGHVLAREFIGICFKYTNFLCAPLCKLSPFDKYFYIPTEQRWSSSNKKIRYIKIKSMHRREKNNK